MARAAGVAAEDIARAVLLLKENAASIVATRSIYNLENGSAIVEALAEASAARLTALLRSYDAVLGEACAALGYTQLLGVLPPGPELDHERERVEKLLSRAGLVLEETP